MKWISRITDRYTKKSDSNIGKLISMIREEFDELLTETNESIIYYQDIKNARGKVLDRYGQDIGQDRLGMDDESYLFMILTKDRADYSIGDVETINEMMTLLLGDDYKGTTETWNNPLYDEVAGIIIYYDSDRFFPRLTFDGQASFDGEYIFAGIKPGQFQKDSLKYMKQAINRIVEKGVKIYYAIPKTYVIDATKEYDQYTTRKNDRLANKEKEYSLSNLLSDVQPINETLRFDGSTSFYGLHKFDGKRKEKYYFDLEVI